MYAHNGDIVLITGNPKGIGYGQKTRPWMVIGPHNPKSTSTIIAPLSTKYSRENKYNQFIDKFETGLERDSEVILSSLTSTDLNAINPPIIGHVSRDIFSQIKGHLERLFDLKPEKTFIEWCGVPTDISGKKVSIEIDWTYANTAACNAVTVSSLELGDKLSIKFAPFLSIGLLEEADPQVKQMCEEIKLDLEQECEDEINSRRFEQLNIFDHLEN